VKATLLLIILIVIGALSFTLKTTEASGDPWYNESWSYRIYQNVTGANETVTSYQMGPIVIHYGSGSNSYNAQNGKTQHLYLAGKCQNDFDDIRFVKGDGTVLSHFRDYKYDGDNATFWFKWDTLANDATVKIYIYYGNPSATDTSQPESTFFYVNDHAVSYGPAGWTGPRTFATADSWTQGPSYLSKTVWWKISVDSATEFKAWSGTYDGSNKYTCKHVASESITNVVGNYQKITAYEKQVIIEANNYFGYTQLTSSARRTISSAPRGGMYHYKTGTVSENTQYTFTYESAWYWENMGACCRKYHNTEPSFGAWGTEELANEKYYFNFQHHDIDNNVIDSLVSWELYNGSEKLTYSEGEATLSSGTYTLQTYKENHLLDSRDLSTTSYGNSTISVNIQYKQHNNVANGYVTSNRTISGIIIESQTAASLAFSINGTTTNAFCYIGVSEVPQDAYLNGDNFTSYTYISTTTPKHLYFAYVENGTYSFTFNPTLPPTPSTGGPSGGPATSFSKRLRITVTNHDEPVQQANVTVYGVPEDPATVYYQFSDVFGRVTFRLKAGVYKILVQHDVLGNRHRTVNLDSNYDLTIEYTDADEATGGPLSILPQWDLTSEQGILFIAIPIGAVALYAGSIALRSKRKWKYSYL